MQQTLSKSDELEHVSSLDSFLLSKRAEKSSDSMFKYMLFVWNGRTATPLVKAMALTKGFELDALLNQSNDCLL
jgi:hypothetical protein